MNTTAAALQANVTTATIRTWCRVGAVSAIKQAGRWIVDTASLATRIAIGAMRIRKQAPMTEPVEHRIDDTYTIRAEQKTSPAYGTTAWYAKILVNGYATTIPYSGATADEAIGRALKVHQAARAQAVHIEDSIVADLTVGPVGGIHAQLGSLATEPRRARDGECHYCGLDTHTCDCH